MATNINLTRIETDLSTFHTSAATGKVGILSSGTGVLPSSMVWKRGTSTVIGARQKSTTDGGSTYSYYHNEFGSIHVRKGSSGASIADASVYALLLEKNDQLILQLSVPDSVSAGIRIGWGDDLDSFGAVVGSSKRWEYTAQSTNLLYMNSAKLQMYAGKDIGVGNTVRGIADTPVTGYIELLSSTGERFYAFGVTTRPASI